MANTATVSSQTTSAPLILQQIPANGIERATVPGVVVALSSGANLTFSVEATNDDVPSTSGNWAPVNSSATGLTAATTFALTGRCTAVRLNVTAYTGGSANITLVS